jgi:hypothetical protein
MGLTLFVAATLKKSTETFHKTDLGFVGRPRQSMRWAITTGVI